MIKKGDVVRLKSGGKIMTVVGTSELRTGRCIYCVDDENPTSKCYDESGLELLSAREIKKAKKINNRKYLKIGRVTISSLKLYVGIAVTAYGLGAATISGFRKYNNLELVKKGTYISYSEFNKILNEDYIPKKEYEYLTTINKELISAISKNNDTYNNDIFLQIKEKETDKAFYQGKIIDLNPELETYEKDKFYYESEIEKLRTDLKTLYSMLK